jgi:energy-coupling factor transport system substrate-specific component
VGGARPGRRRPRSPPRGARRPLADRLHARPPGEPLRRGRRRADDPRDGSFGHLVNLTSFGILALRAAGRPATDIRIRHALGWLARQQNADGGFNFAGRGSVSGIDDTAGALQGLVAGGARPGGRAAQRAASFLAGRQNRDGGFPLTPGGESNAQSTAWAVQGLLAAGRNPARVRRGGSLTPLAYLRSLTGADGAVHYSPRSAQTPVWVTAQALTALAGRTFPIR